MMGFGDGPMYWGGGFMWIFWVLVIAAVVVIVKRVMTNNLQADRSRDETPLSILKRRYARGEIDDEEFKRRCQQLEE